MPIIRGAASDFTTLARVNSTQTTDPEKKSRTFVAPNKAVIAPIVNGSTMSMLPLSGTITFAYTGGLQRFTVHPQVTSVSITLLGAGGASHGGGSYVNGGNGGLVSGRLPVNPGEALDILVGGGGSGVTGGFGGGGTGYDIALLNTPGGGGGRTAIRRNNVDIVTAGGGGGAGRGVSGRSGIGGAGGGLSGQDSQVDPDFPSDSTATLGKGGTQTAGGAGGANGGYPGSQYQGGNGANGTFTGLSLSNSVGGSMTITGFATLATGSPLPSTATITGSSDANLNGTFTVTSWGTSSVVVTTNYLVAVSGITGATMQITPTDDTGGGGGGWYGGGGGGDTVGSTYGGGGGGGSSYVALLDSADSIVNTQGGGALGGTNFDASSSAQPGGNGSCIIRYTINPRLRDWKSLPFNGRIYIT